MLYEMFSVVDPNSGKRHSPGNAAGAANHLAHNHRRYADRPISSLNGGTFSTLKDAVPETSLLWCELEC
jgi:hypothetical protein